MPTVSPQFSPDGEYIGSSIDNGRPSFHNGVVPQGFHVDPSTGESQVFELEENDPSSFNISEYESALTQAHPELSSAMEWSQSNWSQERIQDYNQRVESGDPEQMNLAVEELLNDFSTSLEPKTESEDLSEISDEEFMEIDDYLEGQQPGGDETAFTWMQAAVDSQQSDPCYSDICAATAAFHKGEINHSEAIESLLEKYSPTQLKHYYNYLTKN